MRVSACRVPLAAGGQLELAELDLEGSMSRLAYRVASQEALPDVLEPVLQGDGLGLGQSDVKDGHASLEAA
jgi:hypothetical protein